MDDTHALQLSKTTHVSIRIVFLQHTGLVAGALVIKADHPCIIFHGNKHTILEEKHASSMPLKSINGHYQQHAIDVVSKIMNK